MKIRTSYFYQIRNFTRNMIPISTAVWDPTWYHNFTNDYNYIFKDKRNILNGLRLESIIEQGKNLIMALMYVLVIKKIIKPVLF